MCEPITKADLEKRKHAGSPPNGEEKRKMGTENGAGVTWRSVVDWLVRGALMLVLYLMTGTRSDMSDVRSDVTELRVDMAAMVTANAQQTAEITTVRSTDVALMNLLNEVTANVAMLTERVNQTQGRVERIEDGGD